MAENAKKSPKIGIVDIPFVVNHTPSVLALRQLQQQNAVAIQQWINGINAQLMQEQNLQNRQNLANVYQSELNKRQQALQVQYAQMAQGIDAELSKVITDVAKQEKLDYVFAKGMVVFGADDITVKVIEAQKK